MGAIWLVCDTSGSMIEGGKRLIVRGLVRQVEQFFRLGYGRTRKLQLVLWAGAAIVAAIGFLRGRRQPPAVPLRKKRSACCGRSRKP